METLLKSRKFEVVRRMCEGRDGVLRAMDIVVHPGAVVILPLIDDRQCLMLRQWRPTLQKELWELPAGTLDVPGEPPEVAAARELEEETGHVAGAIRYLCEFYPSPGILTELIRAYVATDLRKTEQHLEPTERITVETVKVADAMEMVRDGEITDGKTIITLCRWAMETGGLS